MDKYYGNYRGVVVYNQDPQNKGRVKIYIPGIYPTQLAKDYTKLPWAEPVMSLFGGNWKGNAINRETGVCSVPTAGGGNLDGAEVWVFFEAGDIQFPQYFGASQSGQGWVSEHPHQHVIKTDSVSVQIDELPNHPFSTSQTESNNEHCSPTSKKHHQKIMTTRVDITIANMGQCAINLNILGDVNLKQTGTMYLEQDGDRHETLIGDRYVYHKGALEYVHEGYEKITRVGNTVKTQDGKVHEIQNGDVTKTVDGDTKTQNNGDVNTAVIGQTKHNHVGDVDIAIKGGNKVGTEGITEITSTKGCTVSSGASLNLLANGSTAIKGVTINLN